jgi:hypothetical protein
MNRTVVTAFVLAACGPLASAAHAHHSHPAFYDFCTRVTIEGRIDSVEWKDPHTQIHLTLDDGTAYRVEWTSLSALQRQNVAGLAQKALTVGARVAATGHPMRDPARIRARFPNVSLSGDARVVDPLRMRRADDSWSWALPPNPNPPPCP